jgi:cytidylate kinase
MRKNIRIAISGKSGCGNTTVSKLAAQTLGLRFINFTFRNLAQEKKLSLQEVLRLAESDDCWDKEVDRRQVELALSDSENGCVLGSRLAIWMLKEACLKVYLKASADIRVERIIKREGGDKAQVSQFTEERDAHDRLRYLRLYDIDIDEYSFADLVIDAGAKTPQEIVEQITSAASKL